MDELNSKDIKKLNSKRGLKLFLGEDDMTISKALRILNYESKLKKLQEELIIMQQWIESCLLYTSPSPRDRQKSRMPSSA